MVVWNPGHNSEQVAEVYGHKSIGVKSSEINTRLNPMLAGTHERFAGSCPQQNAI